MELTESLETVFKISKECFGVKDNCENLTMESTGIKDTIRENATIYQQKKTVLGDNLFR